MTGAGGFVGQALVERLASTGRLAADGPAIARIDAVDSRLPGFAGSSVRPLAGDLSDPVFRDALLSEPVDLLFHLAAIPGGAAERDYRLGWRVNVEATVELFEAIARQARPARIVFASSIGVFGTPLPAAGVDDDTLPLPSMSYGAQKLIAETLLADLSRRGAVDGLGLRLPGIVARPRIAGGHLSAFLSDIFHALAAAEPFTCPVSATATTWLMSRRRCVDNLVHAAALPAARIGARRSFNLPALRVSMEELVEGLAGRFGGHVRRLVNWRPDAALQAQFGSYPPLDTAIADALGFRHDCDAAMLVARALDLAPALPEAERGAA